MTAFRGGVGFLTRVPVGHDGDTWTAFSRRPAVFPAVGYLLGGIVALPLALRAAGIPPVVVASAVLVWLYLVSGINHVDGLADLGDALVVHGEPVERHEILADTVVGVGALLAVGVALLGTALGMVAVASLPLLQAAAILVAAEVGAKLVMGLLACLGTAAFEGLGSTLTEASRPREAVGPVLVALPAVGLSWPTPAAAGALLGALAGGGLLAWYANRLLAGVNGDVFGAANEVARLVGLHAGVIAWTLS